MPVVLCLEATIILVLGPQKETTEPLSGAQGSGILEHLDLNKGRGTCPTHAWLNKPTLLVLDILSFGFCTDQNSTSEVSTAVHWNFWMHPAELLELPVPASGEVSSFIVATGRMFG